MRLFGPRDRRAQSGRDALTSPYPHDLRRPMVAHSASERTIACNVLRLCCAIRSVAIDVAFDLSRIAREAVPWSVVAGADRYGDVLRRPD